METETEVMATEQTRKPRGVDLTAEQEARVEAIRARHRTPEARAEEARARETLDGDRAQVEEHERVIRPLGQLGREDLASSASSQKA
jgi:hypothetical protein